MFNQSRRALVLGAWLTCGAAWAQLFTVASDTFAPTGPIAARPPQVSAIPDAGWQVISYPPGTPVVRTTADGNPPPAASLNSDIGLILALPIESAGTYVKPATMRVQVDVAPGGYASVGLGFYSEPAPNAAALGNDVTQRFTGLALDSTGNIWLVEDGIRTAYVPYSGAPFDPALLATLGYTVDLATGEISDVQYSASDAGYAFTTRAFTAEATRYVGLAADVNNGLESVFDNFQLTALVAGSPTDAGAADGGSMVACVPYAVGCSAPSVDPTPVAALAAVALAFGVLLRSKRRS